MPSEKNNPRFLNLDELEFNESDICIRHEGEDHKMRTLTVERFIAHQKRVNEQEKLMQAGEVDEDDIESAVEIMSDSIQDFFPTLNVKSLDVAKMFKIFAWFTEISNQINEDAPVGDDDADGEVGNGEKKEAVES